MDHGVFYDVAAAQRAVTVLAMGWSKWYVRADAMKIDAEVGGPKRVVTLWLRSEQGAVTACAEGACLVDAFTEALLLAGHYRTVVGEYGLA